MIRPSRWLAGTIASAVLMNSIAFAGGVAPGVQVLQNEVKNLRAQIDLGTTSPSDAIDTFAKSLADKNVSVEDVNQYVKSRLSVHEYQAFRAQMDAALAGIDPAHVSSEELGEIVGQALQHVGTDGLSWSSCASTWTGVGAIVAAVVVGIFAIIKSKSVSAIQKDYAEQRSTKTNNFNNLIDRSNNWQSRIPGDINDNNTRIQYDYQQIEYYRQMGYSAQDQSQAQEYSRYIQEYSQDIYYRNQSNMDLQALWSRYTADPGQAIADAANYAAQLDSTLADLVNQEAQAVANAPANQRLGRNLGIGAGVGAAAGTYLLVRGIHDGGC